MDFLKMFHFSKYTEAPKDASVPAMPAANNVASSQETRLPATPETKKVEAPTLPVTAPIQSEPAAAQLRPEIRPHAFVIMPFGKKKGGDGQIFDFNAIYTDLLKPMLIMAGFEPFRADEETKSGDILTDMFQELLLADLALVDMSIDNANVFYELGIRHAFRKRGVVHIQAGRSYMPFDVFNVRTIPYHITPEGVPDPAFLEKDRAAIARVTRDTWASEKESIHSPVFNLLTGLAEPDRKTLRTPLATGFWREYNEWKERVTIAQRRKRIGDLLLLTEEIRNPLIKEEAIGEAGRALANMGRNELALDQYRKGLEMNSSNMMFRREEAFHLNRLGRVDEAIVKIESLLADTPNDSEAISYLGRIYKEMWVDSWKKVSDKKARLKAAFDSYHWLLKAIDTYLTGYKINFNEYYPGVNALTLATILVQLADSFENKQDPDPEIKFIRDSLKELRGSMIFSLETKSDDEKADYWTLISLAELRVLTAEKVESVVRSYRKALTASRRNQFYLKSSLSQLEMLESLGMRETYVTAAIQVIKEELSRIQGENPAEKKQAARENEINKRSAKNPADVFLFSGYMIDYPSKEQKTFSKEKEVQIRNEIEKRLDKLNAGAEDIAITAGLSAGSEIIFAEVCAARGIHVEAHLPLPEAAYIREFVSPGGDEWVDRFYKIRSHPLVDEAYQLEHVGEPKEGVDAYERNNRWALYSSLLRGMDHVYLITLWDGKSGYPKDRDARLVKHMVELMRDIGGKVEHINSSKFMHAEYIDGAFDGLPDLSKPKSAPKPKAPVKKKK